MSRLFSFYEVMVLLTSRRSHHERPAFYFMPNQPLLLYGAIALGAVVLLYLIWPYLVGFLAVVGAVHLYRVWRQHAGR